MSETEQNQQGSGEFLTEEQRQKAKERMKKETERSREFGKRDDAEFRGSHMYLPVPLPSGGVFDDNGMQGTVVLREMTSELDELLSMAAQQENVGRENYKDLLISCIDQFGDYTDESAIRSTLNNMLHNDYLYLFMKLRQLSVEDAFRFRSECSNERCNYVDEYEVQLSELKYDMPVEPTEDARHQHTFFEKINGKGWDIHWHFMTVKGSEDFHEFIRNNRQAKKRYANMKQRDVPGNNTLDVGLLASLLVPRIDRIVEPSGREVEFTHSETKVNDDDKLNYKEALEYFEERMPWDIRKKFDNVLDEEEPGVNETVHLPCVRCGEDVAKNINVFDANFYMPSG